MRFISIFLLLACLSRGASYFVDYVGGADTNAGTTSGTAFKHCPGDPAATNTASSTTLAADDFVFFKGGVTYVLTGATGILITSSGTSGHPITYDGNSAGTFGTGKAILTNNYAVSNQAALDGGASTRSYITTKYFTVQNMGGSAVLPTDTGSAVASRPGYAVTYGGGSVGCIVDQIDVNGCGYVYNQKPMDSSSIDSTAVYLINPSGATVSNCTFTRVAVPVSIGVNTSSALSASTISGCTFHDWIKWCVDLNVTVNTANFPPVNVNGCTFYDTPQYDAANWTGYGGAAHTDGIFMRNDFYAASWATTIISNNFFYHTASVVTSGGSGWISVTEGPSVAIVNNRFAYGQKSRGSIYIHNTSTPLSPANPQVIIANNSAIAKGDPILTFQGPGFGTTSFTVRNNAFFQTSTATTGFTVVDDNGSSSMAAGSINYDLYETNNPSNAGTYGGTLGQDIWSSTSVLPTDYGITVIRGTPRFWDLNGDNNLTRFNTINADPLLCNLHTLSNSFARNAGTNLTSLGVSALLTDAAGVARPAAGAWDMGAYQDSTSTAFTSSLTGKVILTGKVQIK